MALSFAVARTCRRKILGRYFSTGPTNDSKFTRSPRKGDKVVVGMSGGVDSSVAALLLSKQEYDLSAVFMRNWDTWDESGSDKGCEWEKDWEDVRRVCKQLSVPCELIDLSKDYWTRVFEPSLHSWERGITPNPDVWCNKEIKFGALLDRLSARHPSTFFATGHYARKGWGFSSSESPVPLLLRAKDSTKDQTYFLSSISHSSLSRALFPLGDLAKTEVRNIAKEHGLITAERAESMGVCFVGEKGRFREFLAQYIPPSPGPIIDKISNKVIGTHTGLWTLTIGENARVAGMKQKMFVSSKDTGENTIYVVPGSTHTSLYAQTIDVPDFRPIWHGVPLAQQLGSINPRSCDGKGDVKLWMMHRYRMKPVPCVVDINGNALKIFCQEPQHAVTPGQVAVLYGSSPSQEDGNGEMWCLGSGIISSASVEA